MYAGQTYRYTVLVVTSVSVCLLVSWKTVVGMSGYVGNVISSKFHEIRINFFFSVLSCIVIHFHSYSV